MADLTNKTPLDTYKSLLNVGTADNQELDTTLRIVEDGAGNDSDLKIATNKVRINTKLGIGKDPNYGLDVLTTSAISGIFDNNQDTNMISIQDQDTTSITHVGVGAQDDDFFIRAGNAEKFRIKSDGKVGIGTTSPDTLLHVMGETSIQPVNYANDQDKFLIKGGASNNDAWDGHVGIKMKSDGSGVPYLTLRATNNDTLNVKSSKVGIGTASPDVALEINGGAGTDLDPLLRINKNVDGDGSATGILIGAVNAGQSKSGIFFENKGLGSGRGNLYFCNDNTADTSDATIADARMTIMNDGKVGIGTTTPSAPLTVKTTVEGNCLQLISTESGALAAPNIDLFRQSSSPADNDVLGKIVFKGRNDADGNVAYAAIYGQLMDASNGETDGKIRMFVKKNGTDKGSLDLNSSSAIFNYSAADIDFRVMSQNNSYCLHLNAAQDNVGIGGTPNASYILDVQRTTAGYAQRILNNSTAGSSHGLLITAGKDEEHASHPLFIENQAGDDLLKITAKGTMSLGGNVNSNEYMIYAKARAGVDSRILLDGSGNTAESNISIQNKYGNRFCWISSADEGSSNSGIKFGTGNAGTPSERMRIDKDGKVGIGITNPVTPLHIQKEMTNNSDNSLMTIQGDMAGDLGTEKVLIDFTMTDNNANNYPQVKIGAAVGRNADADNLQKEGSGAFVVYTAPGTNDTNAEDNTTERMRVDYQGNVGIGTTAPATTLDVRGSVSVGQGSEVTIASGVITVTDSYHKVDTEGDASSDNLDTINGGQIGQMLFLRQVDSGRDVVLTESGNIILPGSTFTLSNAADLCLLLYTGSNWQMVSTSDNA